MHELISVSLDIKYEHKTIQDLSATIFYIWNSGNDIINAQDIVVTKGLKIRSDKDQILDTIINAFTDMPYRYANIEQTQKGSKTA